MIWKSLIVDFKLEQEEKKQKEVAAALRGQKRQMKSLTEQVAAAQSQLSKQDSMSDLLKEEIKLRDQKLEVQEAECKRVLKEEIKQKRQMESLTDQLAVAQSQLSKRDNMSEQSQFSFQQALAAATAQCDLLKEEMNRRDQTLEVQEAESKKVLKEEIKHRDQTLEAQEAESKKVLKEEIKLRDQKLDIQEAESERVLKEEIKRRDQKLQVQEAESNRVLEDHQCKLKDWQRRHDEMQQQTKQTAEQARLHHLTEIKEMQALHQSEVLDLKARIGESRTEVDSVKALWRQRITRVASTPLQHSSPGKSRLGVEALVEQAFSPLCEVASDIARVRSPATASSALRKTARGTTMTTSPLRKMEATVDTIDPATPSSSDSVSANLEVTKVFSPQELARQKLGWPSKDGSRSSTGKAMRTTQVQTPLDSDSADCNHCSLSVLNHQKRVGNMHHNCGTLLQKLEPAELERHMRVVNSLQVRILELAEAVAEQGAIAAEQQAKWQEEMEQVIMNNIALRAQTEQMEEALQASKVESQKAVEAAATQSAQLGAELKRRDRMLEVKEAENHRTVVEAAVREAALAEALDLEHSTSTYIEQKLLTNDTLASAQKAQLQAAIQQKDRMLEMKEAEKQRVIEVAASREAALQKDLMLSGESLMVLQSLDASAGNMLEESTEADEVVLLQSVMQEEVQQLRDALRDTLQEVQQVLVEGSPQKPTAEAIDGPSGIPTAGVGLLPAAVALSGIPTEEVSSVADGATDGPADGPGLELLQSHSCKILQFHSSEKQYNRGTTCWLTQRRRSALHEKVHSHLI